MRQCPSCLLKLYEILPGSRKRQTQVGCGGLGFRGKEQPCSCAERQHRQLRLSDVRICRYFSTASISHLASVTSMPPLSRAASVCTYDSARNACRVADGCSLADRTLAILLENVWMRCRTSADGVHLHCQLGSYNMQALSRLLDRLRSAPEHEALYERRTSYNDRSTAEHMQSCSWCTQIDSSNGQMC